MRLMSIYTSLDHIGGAGNVCVSLHQGLLETGKFKSGKIVSKTSFEELALVYKQSLKPEDYQKFNIKSIFKQSEEWIIISHHRKLTTYLILMSKLYRKKMKLIHIAHNVFENLKYFTLFPKTTIAVSKAVEKNLKSYFNLSNTQVIYNGIKPPEEINSRKYNPNNIIITLPAIIWEVKQQLLIADFLKDKMPKNIILQFAGNGPDFDALKKIVKRHSQLKALGYIENVSALYKESDYVLLFSKIEGLPLSLIEAQSYGVPIICNNVGGNLEILKPDKNGFYVADLEALSSRIQSLENVNSDIYNSMKQASLNNFNQNFRFDIMIERYMKVIRKLC